MNRDGGRPRGWRGRRGQRGIALLTAVVLVALATVVATAIAFDTTLAARRGGGGAAYDEAVQIAAAAEAIAAYAIVDQRRAGNAAIHGQQVWARPIGPVEVVPGATLEARLEDLQGRFNLNNLTQADGTANPEAIEVFRRLLEYAGLKPDWAPYAADWIDEDVNAGPGGAEDGVYSSETPSYRPPNRVITSPTELLALKDFGPENYAKIAPYVTALPRGTPINLCTASGALLDALSNQQQWSGAPDALQRMRSGKCFPDKAAFEAQFQGTALTTLGKALAWGETSDYFQLRTIATIGTSEFALYSLLHHEGSSPAGAPRVRVVTRAFTE
jgi:general secretion pathway protein K